MAELSQTTLYTDANLQGYYPLSGSVTADSGPNGRTLTNTGSVALTPNGKFVNAADFGTAGGKYLTQSNTMNINGGSMSMTCWFLCAAEPSGATYNLMYQGNITSDVSFRMRYTDTAGTKTLVFRRERAGTANDDASATISALGLTTWHHIVYTYDGSTVLGYLDNAQVATGSFSGNGASDPLAGFSIGATPNGSQPTSGYICDAAIFDRKLTTTEIALLYNDGPRGAALFF